MGCIYFVTNLVNGKQYVGKTKFLLPFRRNIHERCACRGLVTVFGSALRKYGFENFEWEEVYSDVANEDLNRLEIECIEWFGTKVPDGYNMTEGGDGTSGWHHTEETKEKIRSSERGKIVSYDTRIKIGKAKKGRKHTEETRKKLSKSRLGKKRGPMSLEQIAKIKATMNLPEVRENIRKSALNRSPEALANFRKVMRTQEVRDKISKAGMGRKATPETRERLRQAWIKRRKNKQNG